MLLFNTRYIEKLARMQSRPILKTLDKAHNIKRVAQIFQADHRKLNDNTHLSKHLGGSELGHIDLCMHMEDDYNINIPDKEMNGWKTINDVHTTVAKHLKKMKTL